MKNRNQELLDKFGERIRLLRKQKGMSQEELAYQADIPISQVGRIERGEINVTLNSMAQLTKALDLDLHSIFKEL